MLLSLLGWLCSSKLTHSLLSISGAIYTCISVELIDLIYNWSYVSGGAERTVATQLTTSDSPQEYRARTRLTVSILFACIGFGIGLLPGLDNW